MSSIWNERYGSAEYVYGTEPNDFLVAHAAAIPRGAVLCLADGEGRNGVYLAKLGYAVTSVDQSEVGLRKAEALAASQGVSIHTLAADLAEFDPGQGIWQGIVSVFAHLPPELRLRLHRQVVAALAPGGVFILEAFTPRQLDMPGVGGPKGPYAAGLIPLDAVRDELEGLTLEIAREADRVLDEGPLHQGLCAVVQVLAIKPD